MLTTKTLLRVALVLAIAVPAVVGRVALNQARDTQPSDVPRRRPISGTIDDALKTLQAGQTLAWDYDATSYLAPDPPLALQVRVRTVALPKLGAATAYLETDAGTLTVSGELDEGPLLRWLILHGGQAVTLTVETKPVSSASR